MVVPLWMVEGCLRNPFLHCENGNWLLHSLAICHINQEGGMESDGLGGKDC